MVVLIERQTALLNLSLLYVYKVQAASILHRRKDPDMAAPPPGIKLKLTRIIRSSSDLAFLGVQSDAPSL